MAASPTDGLYFEFHIPLGLKTLLEQLIVESPQNRNSPVALSGTAVNRQWFSLPRPAIPGGPGPRVPFFYCTGTAYVLDFLGTGVFPIGSEDGEDVWIPGWPLGTGKWAKLTPRLDPFPYMLDLDIWSPKKIEYPAGGFPMWGSIDAGKDAVIREITNTSGPFALGGYSQGAAVVSEVFQEIWYPGGSLYHRKNDLIAGVTFGNPMREEDHTWPGSLSSGSWDVPDSTTGGHGCFPNRLVNTPDLWWDFAQDDDVVASVGGREPGEAWTYISGVFINAFNGGSWLQFLLQGLFGLLEIALDTILDAVNFAINEVGSDGHMAYPLEPPTGDPENGLTSYQIALRYLNEVGAETQAAWTFSNQTEVLTTTFKLPLSVSEISFDALRVPCTIEVWYQDRQSNWRALLNETRDPVTLNLTTSSAASWYTFHSMVYPVVAKAIQIRIARVPENQIGPSPYVVGIRNTLIRRNVYDRSQGKLPFEEEQDPLGNIITKYIKDWDANKAVDDKPVTFWRSAPQPDPEAVVNLFLDVRDDEGASQLIDKIYIDPVYTGQRLNLYYTNDEAVDGLRLSSLTMAPETDTGTDWRAGVGRWDIAAAPDTSAYYMPVRWGPMVRQDIWIGIVWAPDFLPSNVPGTNPILWEAVPEDGSVAPASPGIPYAVPWTIEAPGASGSTELVASTGSVPARPRIYYDSGAPAVVLEFVDINGTLRSYTANIIPSATTLRGSGTATAGTPISLNDSGASWTANQWAGYYLLLTGGTGAGQAVAIASNSGTQITPVTPFLTPPDATSTYEIWQSPARAGEPLRIAVGWSYATNTLAIKVADRQGRVLGSTEYTDPDLPYAVSFDGMVGMAAFRGTFSAHIVKRESYATGMEDFLANPAAYVSPDPVIAGADGIIPTSSLDNALYVADWTIQEHGTGGIHYTAYQQKFWTPIWRDYITQRGNIRLPQAIPMRYLKLEFSGLTEESYPVYDAGIKTTYKVFPVTVQQQATQRHPGLLGTIGGLFSVGAEVLVTGLGSVNWLQPSTVANAVNSVFGPVVSPVTIQTGPGYVTESIPGTAEDSIQNSARVEASTPYVYRRPGLDPFNLAATQVYYAGFTWSQTLSNAFGLLSDSIKDTFSPLRQIANNPGTGPIQGSDWWLLPGGTLKMPATVMNGLTGLTEVVLGRKSTTETRLRFTTESIHRYDVRTVTRDAAVAYFAGVREILPLVTTYIEEEDPVVFEFNSYSPSQWITTNERILDTGPVTTAGKVYSIPNPDFDEGLGDWYSDSGSWTWDGSAFEGRWYPGTAEATATGTETVLSSSRVVSPPGIDFEEGDEVTFSVWVRWRDFVATDGEAGIRLGLRSYLGDEVVDDTIVLAEVAYDDWSAHRGSSGGVMFPWIFPMDFTFVAGEGFPYVFDFLLPSNGSSYQELRGTWTVPAGVDGARIKLMVTEAASEGSVWFDTVTIETTDVVAYLHQDFYTTSAFSKVRCEFQDSGVVRSDPMWARTITLPPSKGTGTISTGGTEVIGDGTAFTTELSGVTAIQVGTEIRQIDHVSSNTQAQLRAPFSADIPAGTMYSIQRTTSTADQINTNISGTALAYYTDTIPDDYTPAGVWADTFATWADDSTAWGAPNALVAIDVDPVRVYDGQRVLHFTRAEGAGEAGIKVRQRTNFVRNGMFRLCARWYKPRNNTNTIVLRLRRLSDGVYIHEEVIDSPVTGYWYEYQTEFHEIPDTAAQAYTVELTVVGEEADEFYLSDLWVEISHIRYFMRIGSIGAHLFDVTGLRYADTAVVSNTVPANEFSIDVQILSPKAYVYGCKAMPVYLE